MIHINPIDYPKLNKREIKLISTDTTNIFKVELGDGVRLFYGKKLTIFIDNISYIGRYSYSLINEEKTNLLIFDTDSCPNITGEKYCTVYETFVVPDDNQAITYQDLQEKFESHKQPVKIDSISGIKDIGSNNLVDGFQTLKIDQSLYGFKTATDITISENSDPFFNLRIEPNKLNRYHIYLYSNNASKTILVNLELVFNGDSDNYYIINHSHISQQSSFENEKNQFINGVTVVDNIILSLTKVTYTSGQFVAVKLQLKNHGSYNLTGYIECRHPSNLWVPDESEKAGDFKSLILNNQSTLEIDQTLLFADKHGEQRTVIYGTTIGTAIPVVNNSNIGISSLPIGYYTINKDTAPFGLPGITDSTVETYSRDLSEQKKYFETLEWTDGLLIVMSNGQYMFYSQKIDIINNTCDKYVFVGSKFDIKDAKWQLLSIHGHTHNTDDLIIGDTNKFVTDKQINIWNDATNKVKNNSWKTFDDSITNYDWKTNVQDANLVALLSKKGFATIQFDTLNNPIIQVFDGTKIVPVSIGALTVESQYVSNPETKGTLITQKTLDVLKGLGIGYRINSDIESTLQLVLITNDSSLYGKTENNFFDLVERYQNTQPGDNSINIGLLNGVTKDNSVIYGVGLKSANNAESNKTIIGTWNNPIEGALFEIGAGTDELNCSTIVWYKIDSYTDILEDGSTSTWYNKLFCAAGNFFNGNDSQVGYILVNGQEPVINDFVHYDEFRPVKETVDEIIENSIFIKLIPLDESLKPVIQRVLALDDYSEYNTYFISLLITGGFGEIVNEQRDDDGDLLSIEWGLKSRYVISTEDIENPNNPDTSTEDEDDEGKDPIDEDTTDVLEITTDNFEDDGTLIVNLKKSTILKISDSETGKNYEINMFDYVNSLTVLNNKISLNVEAFQI